jgi:hypothetical protein
MDKKKLNENVLKAYIKDLSPFEAYPEPAKYKMLGVNTRTNPRWYKYEQDSLIQRKHHYAQIPYKSTAPVQAKKVNEFLQNLPYQQQ